MSMSDAWVTGRGSPYYPLDNRVGVVRSTSMIPSPVCSVAAWITLSLYVILIRNVAVLPRHPMIRGAHVFSGRVRSMFLADPRFFTGVGLGQLFIVWSGLAARVKLYTEIRSVAGGQRLVCVPRTFVGSSIYIVTSVLTQRELDHHCSVFNILVDLRPEFPDRDADELNVNAGKMKKRVAFVSGSPHVKKARTEGVIISDSWPSTAGKSPTASRRLIRQSGQANTSSVSAAPATKDDSSSSVTPTPEHASGDDNLRTRPPSSRFVVLSSSSTDTDIPTSPQVIPPVSSAQASVSVPVTEPVSDGRTSSVHELEAETFSATPSKSPTASRRLIRQSGQANTSSVSAAPATKDDSSSSITPTPEHASGDDNLRTRPPSGRFVVLSSSFTDTDIPTSPQVIPPVSSAQASVSVPVTEPVSDGRTSSVHELEAETFSATPSQGSNANDLYESQTIDSATALNVYVPNWNITINARIDNPVTCRNLLDHVTPPDCDGLRSRVVGKDKVREEFVLQQDAVKRRFVERDVDLDSRIADVRRGMDNDLYPHMLTTIAGRWWVIGHGFRLAVHQYACSVECRSTLGKVISMAINKGIQQGLEAGIVHGKVGRSLTQIEAYDPEVEGKYVAAVSAFENVSFPLLDELEGLKDSPLALIMPSLILKDNHGVADTTPEFSRFQPSLGQRGLCPPPSSKLGGASSSAPPHDSSFGVTYYQLSTLVLSDDRGSATQPPAVQAHNDLFDTSVLDGPGAIPLVDGTWRAINGYDQLLEEQSRMEGQD
nr:putative transposase (putative), gypsy type [Tanacetum cinerariifolium]